MQKIWQKDYTLNKQIETYCFGENATLDNKLIHYDVIGSLAHAKMLAAVGIISDKEFAKLEMQLIQLLKKPSLLIVQVEDEDIHTAVENYLVQKLGGLGKKIHTGRSRNDQVLLDLKLYSKDHLLLVANAAQELAGSFLKLSKKYEFVPMPGYTHMRKAMPSSVGMWAASFAESLIDDSAMLQGTYELNDTSPLGTGAAYGVPININRELSASYLGFSKVQNNSLNAISSRLKNHLAIIQVLSQIMLSLSRFAQDMLLFTSSEFNFFDVQREFTTGSSIMPQKHNLDTMEILRAKSQKVVAYQQTISSLSSGLPSGYNADFAESKGPLFESFDITIASLEVCSLLVNAIEPNLGNLEKACTPEIYAAHHAFELVGKGLTFRDAYHSAKFTAKKSSEEKIKIIQASTHSGSTGNLGLDKIKKELNISAKWWFAKKSSYQHAVKQLIGDF